jgi:hypothetical protein
MPQRPGREGDRLANRAVATAMRQRACHGNGKRPEQIARAALAPLPARLHPHEPRRHHRPPAPRRGVVDLLFFPTGGGKTEAYLGLAAFTLVLRRLRNPGLASAGVSVLMRYTLRLLTLDQLGRAATLICALELERAATRDQRLGPWPFEIGLWVGQAATPNAWARRATAAPPPPAPDVLAYQNDTSEALADPARELPLVRRKFDRNPSACSPTHRPPARARRPLQQPRLRLQRAISPADRRRRRAALSPPALLPHRHRRQVRQPPLGRRGRAPCSATRRPRRQRAASTAPPSPARAARCRGPLRRPT